MALLRVPTSPLNCCVGYNYGKRSPSLTRIGARSSPSVAVSSRYRSVDTARRGTYAETAPNETDGNANHDAGSCVHESLNPVQMERRDRAASRGPVCHLDRKQAAAGFSNTVDNRLARLKPGVSPASIVSTRLCTELNEADHCRRSSAACSSSSRTRLASNSWSGRRRTKSRNRRAASNSSGS